MASSSSQRMIHQDYIARIRYSNALPPPPNPPKLLDIPNTGLSSGQYTTPGFASRLARDQPLNIEADAELGMPLDLVGMPGIFDGDESSIQAPLNPPPVHPHDRALLKPLSSLGKPKFADSGVSFLRRTEYISSYTSKSRFESTTSRSLINNVGSRTKRPANSIDKESPEHIKSEVEKSFQIAAQNLKNTNIRHPNASKRNLKLIDAYEILPDLDSFPDAGGYVAIKFLTNPVPPSTTYDQRLLGSFLKPMEPLPEEEEAKQIARDLHERDPERYPAVEESMEYEFFMTDSVSDTSKFKRKFEDPSSSSPNELLRFKRIRAYESASFNGSQEDKYDDEVALAAYDGKDGLHQKGVYYYPIVQKIGIRPQRTKNIATKKWGVKSKEEEERELERQTDFVDLRIEEPSEELQAQRDVYKTHPYGKAVDEEEEEGRNGRGALTPE